MASNMAASYAGKYQISERENDSSNRSLGLKQASTVHHRGKEVKFFMEINMNHDKKLVTVWLTNSEKSDPQIKRELQQIYDTYKKKKFLVAVFESGSGDLYENTRDLLLFNRRRLAEKEVCREKIRKAKC